VEIMASNNEFITAKKETIEHYRRPEIKETILRFSAYGENTRWAVADNHWWYVKPQRSFPNPLNSKGYDLLLGTFRTLYSTLGFYTPFTFQEDFSLIDPEVSRFFSISNTVGHTFGIDIDTINIDGAHGLNIQEPVVKEAVEAMAQYYVDRLKELAPNSLYVLFSGGGIYVLVHHLVFQPFFNRLLAEPENIMAYQGGYSLLCDAMNKIIADIAADFYAIYPQYRNYVKPDALNHSKRVFKTIYSVHAKHPFAVIPLEADNIKINFDEATLPLSDEVIERGKNWYNTYDPRCELQELIDEISNKLYDRNPGRYSGKQYVREEVLTSPSEIPFEKYPPCIRNMVTLPYVNGAGATRGCAFLAVFLGQMGVPRDRAEMLFFKLRDKWHATGINQHVFDTWYQSKLHCPTCATLLTQTAGYPSIDIVSLSVCQPDDRCFEIQYTNPVYYASQKLYSEYKKRLLLAADASCIGLTVTEKVPRDVKLKTGPIEEAVSEVDIGLSVIEKPKK
jgi:hypothetical protein